MSVFQKIKIILSSRPASIFIFFIAAAGRIIQKINSLVPSGDKASQILATKNLVNGHGVSTLEVFATNLADPQYIPLIKWPPGFSFILAPFYKLSGESFLWGSLWPDLIAAFLFVWFARKTISLFNVPVYLVNLYTLVVGFCLYDFTTSSSSDLITAMFYQVALFLSLRFILSEKKSYATAFLIALVLFVCGLTRYMSLPLAFIIPVYFVASGYVNRNRKFVLNGYFMIAVLTVLTVSLLFLQNSYGGAPVYVMPVEKGFYPENIARTNPFMFSSFLNMTLFCLQIEKLSGFSFSVIAKTVTGIHLVLFFSAALFSFFWIKKKGLAEPSFTEHFIYIGIFSTLAAVALLAFLSITNAAIPTLPPDTWTYIQEGRYFFIPVLFIQLFVFVAVWQYRNSTKKWFYRLLLICMAILFFNTAHSIYFTVKKVVPPTKSIYKQYEEFPVLDYYKSLLNKQIQENNGKNIIVSCADDSYAHYAGLWYDLPGLADYTKLNTLQMFTQKETLIIVPIRNCDRFRLTAFINNPETKVIGEIKDYIFYTINVSPNK